MRLTLQEYFAKPGRDPRRWGQPFAALLGAFTAQQQLGIPAIGGKDSMSGTFKDLDVPPTLVAFAVSGVDVRRVLSPEFKRAGSRVLLLPLARDAREMPDFAALKKNYARVHDLAGRGKILAAQSLHRGGLAEAVSKMCFGNRLGMAFAERISAEELLAPAIGSLVLEVPESENVEKLLSGTGFPRPGTHDRRGGDQGQRFGPRRRRPAGPLGKTAGGYFSHTGRCAKERAAGWSRRGPCRRDRARWSDGAGGRSRLRTAPVP